LKMKVKVVLRQTEALFRELLAYGVDNFDGERRDSGKEMLVKPMVSAGKR